MIESLLRFVNVTTSGLVAGSLGFGDAALVPGWQDELPREWRQNTVKALKAVKYSDAIGPVALASAVTLAVGSRGSSTPRRLLYAAAALSLTGVLVTTVMVTVPINRQIEEHARPDHANPRAKSLVKNWSRAHAVRTTLGLSAFLCAAASGLTGKKC
ncbi:MAG TPA: anthrone oxygenase family protein [Thermoanaerobaculia bacterium]|nr:anthrone oxygenase family protein [Thermoanaerobaculia bacterium]